ncbi:replication initiator [Streptantibioticus rubrisoli]|uniref:Plasmid replication initiator protein n=1 Tax=Streptantibioticus rubrisoli TaxID=1387313 RepID=A0ABT1PP54_9ACTN|nr:replication initiator [Streptantibioticus rubrisoli]MCQ4046050.1 plasmid replication initiator protein [Streptantibioticus rubrisoli]
MRQLSDIDRDILTRAQGPLFHRWLEQIRATGGCAHPIHLTGSTTTRDAATGEVLRHYDTAGEPGERLLVRCRNRRATVCPACSRLHAGDTYHLVRAGLVGGKTVPATVRERPRLFLTLTAPSFGAVHRATGGERCQPRRGGGHCEHGRPVGCGLVHADTDPQVGQPLCPTCYDYPAHILWHAYAGRLWKAFTDNLYNHLAARLGYTRTELRRALRVSYAKIAEYQRRAAVHLHVVVRLDGNGGADEPPLTWATADLLTDTVRTAAAAVNLRAPYSAALGEHALTWGTQLDIRRLRAFGAGEGQADDAVAAYVAKYITKGADDTGVGTDHRITDPAEIEHAPVSPHVRTLMRTCWRLGGLPELAPLRLRAWVHTLGYRSHILTKSRCYSTTYSALRAQRAEYERGPDLADDPGTVTESRWRYADSGHTPGAALIAAGIAQDLARNREIALEQMKRFPVGGVVDA